METAMARFRYDSLDSIKNILNGRLEGVNGLITSASILLAQYRTIKSNIIYLKSFQDSNKILLEAEEHKELNKVIRMLEEDAARLKVAHTKVLNTIKTSTHLAARPTTNKVLRNILDNTD